MPQCGLAITFIFPLDTEISAQRSLPIGALMLLLVTELLLCSPESSLQTTTPFLRSASPVADEQHHSCSLEGCFACPVTSAQSWPRPISDYFWYQWMELHFLQYYLDSSLLLDPNKRYGSPFKFFLPWDSPSALSYQIEFPHIKCPLFNSLSDIHLDSSHTDTLCNTV